MSLDDIKQILSVHDRQGNFILEKRLDELNQEMKKFNIQRQIIVWMLKKKNKPENNLIMAKETFVKVLMNLGLDDAGLDRLHVEYEKIAPEEHQAFLEFVGISSEEIIEIREYFKKIINEC